MKRNCLVLLTLLLVSLCATAQTYEFNLSGEVLRKYQGINKGTNITIVGLRHDITAYSDPYYAEKVIDNYIMTLSDNTEISLTTRIDKAIDFTIHTIDDLWNAAILQDVIPMLIKNGTQVDLRRELENDALECLEKIKSEGLAFNDPYLTNYLYSLIAKIAPSTLIDGRPGSINVLILESPELNASTYPNGTIVINTGLLAALHSEDELIAILAHEIAHFVLDHSLQNVNALIAKKQRAEALAGLLTVATAAAEGFLFYKTDGYYIPGAATTAAAMLAYTISEQAVESFGMEYNHTQELEADQYAIQVLNFLKCDTNALATALFRMANVLINERSKSMYFNSYTHPSLMERIAKLGTPSKNVDQEFEKMVSFTVTNMAYMKYNSRRFRESIVYADQNIRNKVATADDYLLKANCLLALDGSEESDKEVLALINQAKQIDPDNINIYKAEILVELRLKNFASAKTKLEEYLHYLVDIQVNYENIKNESLWVNLYDYSITEQDWARKMIVKISGMAK